MRREGANNQSINQSISLYLNTLSYRENVLPRSRMKNYTKTILISYTILIEINLLRFAHPVLGLGTKKFISEFLRLCVWTC